MTAASISPLPIQHFIDNFGNALNGGKLFTYAAGTATKLSTFTDSTAATPNTNPVLLNTRGEASVWLTPNLAYKFVLSPSTDTDPPTAPIWTIDNLVGGNNASDAQTVLNIAALRALNTGTTPVWVQGYTTAGDGGEGWFNIGAGGTDDNGTIIVSADGTYYREKQGQPFSVRWFGAKGDGVTNDSAGFQSAITAAVAAHGAVYVPSTSVNYLINTALDAHNADQLLIFGDGSYPPYARITPTGGSVIAGNTGTGSTIIDAIGANGLVIRNLTFGTIGMINPSTYGVLIGNSNRATNVPGGANDIFDNVTFLMAPTGSSCAIYGLNANLIKFLNVNTISDYSIYISDSNDLSVTPPYGTFGPDIQSDGIYSHGCSLGGYGSQAPLTLRNANAGEWAQLYIVNVNGGVSYTGQDYAMWINNSYDITMRVEIDYFPTALLLTGVCYDLRLTGIIYQWTTPVPSGQPAIVSFQGTSADGCIFGIRPLQSLAANSNYLYGTASVSPTMIYINNCTFMFNVTITPNTAFLDMTAADPTPLFNNYFNGNSDTVGNIYGVNGSGMSTSGYRIFVNGIKTGVA